MTMYQRFPRVPARRLQHRQWRALTLGAATEQPLVRANQAQESGAERHRKQSSLMKKKSLMTVHRSDRLAWLGSLGRLAAAPASKKKQDRPLGLEVKPNSATILPSRNLVVSGDKSRTDLRPGPGLAAPSLLPSGLWLPSRRTGTQGGRPGPGQGGGSEPRGRGHRDSRPARRAQGRKTVDSSRLSLCISSLASTGKGKVKGTWRWTGRPDEPWNPAETRWPPDSAPSTWPR